ncbi:hypothetical protein WJX73_006973 [Symbiochloris irregularis]|uniref:AFG1-like ATPase n=1 Tax=Symbiochloris irregularis TaxID=706552 RepID=A0AAW1PJ59_9CHLO
MRSSTRGLRRLAARGVQSSLTPGAQQGFLEQSTVVADVNSATTPHKVADPGGSVAWLYSSACAERPATPLTVEETSTSDSSHGDAFLRELTAEHGPAALYKAGRLSKKYSQDPRQEATIMQLQQLYEGLAAALGAPGGVALSSCGKTRRSGLTLVDHKDVAHSQTHWWQGISRVLEGRAAEPAQAKLPKGLYMYGGVGVGKTMLMDLLVKCAPSQFKLRRMHFHDFMLDVHSYLRDFKGSPDPLVQVADAFTKRMKVLCLDEFFVTDVADAAVLSRLFQRMWENGLVLVATSNRVPKDLYEGGLQRDLFLPFIAQLEERCSIHDMNSTTDYRKRSHYRRGLWFAKRSYRPNPTQELVERFEEMVSNVGVHLEPRTIKVQMGRSFKVPEAGGPFAMMPFDSLCGQPVAAADYIALAQDFHTIAIEDVPIFTAATRPQAYRCVTLVDVLYEHRIRLFASSEGTPMDLFQHVVTRADAKSKGTDDNTVVDDELAFASQRTVSRLIEMQSAGYLKTHAQEHAPHLLLALEEAEQAQDKPPLVAEVQEPQAATA